MNDDNLCNECGQEICDHCELVRNSPLLKAHKAYIGASMNILRKMRKVEALKAIKGEVGKDDRELHRQFRELAESYWRKQVVAFEAYIDEDTDCPCCL